jgi:hypothetical protein
MFETVSFNSKAVSLPGYQQLLGLNNDLSNLEQ